jgi:hypothetical protein
MSLFHKIQSGELTREGFEKSLATYQSDKIILQRNALKFSADAFQSKLKDLEMSITICLLFLENFDELSKVPVKRRRLVW